MQDVCHMNFVIDLAHCSLYGSVVEHWSMESEGLRFNSLWGLRIFFFVPCLWQDEKHLSLFLYWAQNLTSLLFYMQNYFLLCIFHRKWMFPLNACKNQQMNFSWKRLMKLNIFIFIGNQITEINDFIVRCTQLKKKKLKSVRFNVFKSAMWSYTNQNTKEISII